MQRDWRSWGVLIQDHHEGYISWAEFERNQNLIADNANGKRFMSRGAIRRGEALLPGLLRCAPCAAEASCPLQRRSAAAINASAPSINSRRRRCIIFSGMRVDRDAVPRRCSTGSSPWAWKRHSAAIEARSQQRSEKQDQLEFALRQARYEAARAQRQYDAIDPENRLVAGELERRWNERLVAVRNLEVEIDQLDAERSRSSPAPDRERLMALGRDLAAGLGSPGPRRRRARR